MCVVDAKTTTSTAPYSVKSESCDGDRATLSPTRLVSRLVNALSSLLADDVDHFPSVIASMQAALLHALGHTLRRCQLGAGAAGGGGDSAADSDSCGADAGLDKSRTRVQMSSGSQLALLEWLGKDDPQLVRTFVETTCRLFVRCVNDLEAIDANQSHSDSTSSTLDHDATNVSNATLQLPNKQTHNNKNEHKNLIVMKCVHLKTTDITTIIKWHTLCTILYHVGYSSF